MDAPTDADLPISRRLHNLAEDAKGETVTLDWILGKLHERAFGLFLLVLALPCCIPFLYGIPQVVSLPLMFVAAQIFAGRTYPWLPARLGARQVSQESLKNLADRSSPWLEKIESISRPRLPSLTRPPLDRIIGLALVIFSASILVPLPGTNTVPGIAVVIIAMGMLQRDGLLVLAGTLVGTVWIATLLLAGATLASLIKGWLGL